MDESIIVRVGADIRDLQRSMRQATRAAMAPFRKQVLETERDMLTLANSMGSFTGSTNDFMNNVKQLGAEHKKASDAMINANKAIGASMIETAGQMMNMSTQASKISANYKRMKNPMLSVNRAGLKIADTMNKIANNGSAAVLSLKMLGPNASMKQLYDMQNMINQGVMRYQTVALTALATGVLVYGGLHKAAMNANKGYEESFNTMIANLKKAFEPMVQVFAAVMTRVYGFVNSIAEMVIKFNEAHPTLAKFIQGILMLIPALTLILSPLSIGIGLFNGMLAAFNSIWMLIAPLVTGLGAMGGTVAIVAIAIAGLTAGIIALWNNSEGFRTAVTEGWQAISDKITSVTNTVTQTVKTVWGELATWWDDNQGDLKEATDKQWGGIDDSISTFLGEIKSTIEANTIDIEGIWGEHGETMKKINEGFWKTIAVWIAIYLDNINIGIQAALKFTSGLFQATWPIISNAVEIAWKTIMLVIENGIAFVKGIINTTMAIIRGDWEGAWNSIKTTAKTICDNIKSYFQGLDLKTVGKDIIKGLISGINSMKDAVTTAAKKIADTVKATIKGALKVASPSRVMRDDVGKWIPAGLIVGINSMKSDVVRAASNMAQWATPEIPEVSIGYTAPTGAFNSFTSALNGTVDVALTEDRFAKSVDTLRDRIDKLELSLRGMTLEMDGYAVAKVQQPYIDMMGADNTKISMYMKGVSR